MGSCQAGKRGEGFNGAKRQPIAKIFLMPGRQRGYPLHGSKTERLRKRSEPSSRMGAALADHLTGTTVEWGQRGYPKGNSPTNLALGPLLVGSGHPARMSRHTAQAGFCGQTLGRAAPRGYGLKAP